MQIKQFHSDFLALMSLNVFGVFLDSYNIFLIIILSDMLLF